MRETITLKEEPAFGITKEFHFGIVRNDLFGGTPHIEKYAKSLSEARIYLDDLTQEKPQYKHRIARLHYE